MDPRVAEDDLQAAAGPPDVRDPVGDGGDPAGAALAVAATGVWVADASAGTVVGIDPGTGRVVSSMRAGDPALAAAVVSGSPCNLSRAITVDDHARTVTFNLTAPDGDFLYKLAVVPTVPCELAMWLQ